MAGLASPFNKFNNLHLDQLPFSSNIFRCCLIICLTWVSSARADELYLHDSVDGIHVSKHLSYWRDMEGTADIETVRGADIAGKFKPTNGRTGFGADSSPYWFRLDLYRPASVPELWWIELPHPLLSDVQLYGQTDNGYQKLWEEGTNEVFDSRPIKHEYFDFPIKVRAEHLTTLYFRVQTNNTLLMSPRIWIPERFTSANDITNMVIGLYYGLILAMVVYNGFLSFKLRDKLYLYYIATSIFHMMSESELIGHNFRFLFPNNLWLSNHQFVLIVPLSGCMMMLFTNKFLELKSTHPKLSLVTSAIAALGVMIPVVGFTISYPLAFKLTMVVSQAAMFTGLVAGILRIRDGYRPALYFVAAEIPLQVAVIILGLIGEGVWPIDLLPQQIMGFSSALEIVLFSLALSDRIALLKRDNEEINAKIKLNDDRWRLALEGGGGGVWEYSISSGETIMSPQTLRMLGYVESEAKTTFQEWIKLVHPYDLAKVMKDRDDYITGNQQSHRSEYRMLCKDGSWKWVQSTGTVIDSDPNGKPTRIVGTQIDISENKHLEESIWQMNDRLEERVAERTHELELAKEESELANRSKSRFLASAGHDLRQPIAAANLYLEVLRMSKMSPKQEEILDNLGMAIENCNDTLDALLNVSKLESGTVQPIITSIDLEEIFKWLQQHFEPLAIEKKLVICFHFPKLHHLYIYSDFNLVKSILLNLVSNAIKFTHRGSILVTARRRSDKVLFQVWDTGVGIPASYSDSIFNEFFQIANPHRDRTHGLGLGLSIAKRAANLLGENITFRSKIGRGSVFEFHLPLNKEINSENLPSASKPKVTNFLIEKDDSFKGKRFFVIEDDMMVAEAVKLLLEEVGCVVQTFRLAQEALHSPDINKTEYFIVDYMLPGGMDGIQFLKELQSRLGHSFRGVLMTGDTSQTFIKEATSYGLPVLFKPVKPATLFATLAIQKG